MATSPTQLTLKKLRADGWIPAVVEKWNPHIKIRQDLFGFIDILAIREGETIAIQATSRANISTRVAKIESDDLFDIVSTVRKAGWRIEVWGWKKIKNRWELKTVDLS